MDPNKALDDLRKLAFEAKGLAAMEHKNCDIQGGTSIAEELAEAFEDLDEWLKKGGFLPETWSAARNAVIEQCALACLASDTDYSGQNTEDFLAAKLRSMKT